MSPLIDIGDCTTSGTSVIGPVDLDASLKLEDDAFRAVGVGADCSVVDFFLKLRPASCGFDILGPGA